MIKTFPSNASTSHKDRLARLSSKIGELRLYTETEKNTKIERVEQRLRDIEENLVDYQESFEKRLNTIRENATSLQRNVETDKKEYDIVLANDIQDLQSFEERLQSAYDSIKQKRREHENSLTQLLEDRTGTLSFEIQRENNLLLEEVKQLTQIYDADYKKLNASLAQETAAREENDEKIQERVERDLKRLDENFRDVKKYSDGSEKKIFDTVKNAVTDIKILLDDEKLEREKTQGNMINLLETAMTKFGPDTA